MVMSSKDVRRQARAARRALPSPKPRCAASGKVQFDSVEDAAAEIRFRAALHASDGSKVPVRSYVCDSCDHFHLTSMPGEPA